MKKPKILDNLKNANTLKVLKWMLRDKYLRVDSKSTSTRTIQYTISNILSYIYSKDKDYIRKYRSITINNNFNKLLLDGKSNKTVINVRWPTASNLVKISKCGFMYYTISGDTSFDNASKTEGTRQYMLNVSIYFFGRDMYSNRKELLDYLKKSFERRFTSDTISIYSGGNLMGRIPIMKKQDIVFREIDYLTNSIVSWSNIRQFYEDRHVTYKLNILLHGLPGTGKTSLIYYICSITNRSLINIDLSSELKKIKDSMDSFDPGKDVIAFEDVDILMTNEKDNELNQKLQYLLQFLDGYLSTQDSIVVLTTNNPDKLDKRLLRKGRIDISLEVKEFNREEAETLCNKFQVDPKLVMKDTETTWNPAELQSRCMETVFIQAFKIIEQDKEN